ncbi:Na+/H+ antiporter subunit E [Nucisporomicrobium flavum]|uniref:Na+/H+ antiporter subunit E n=1 Tax=Nucisporomicrobium flavum TaxID=2785915 RepID=UPI0018F4F40C|nr:Na+/H+ antiporter subunit E [Nucisporomicrobium flavum]
MTAGSSAVRRTRWRDRIVAALVLVAVWMLLWGVFSWATLAGGIVVAAVVLKVFPLPAVTFAGRPHPLGLLRFAVRFAGDLVRASVQLAVLAFRLGHQPRSAIIRVPLRVPSDLVLTLTGEAVSLVPGSLIVDTDQASTTLYIHVIGVADRDAVERFRREVYATEARIVRAIGSEAEIGMLGRPVPVRRREDS